MNLKVNSISSTTNKLNSMQINFTKMRQVPWKALSVIWMLLMMGTVQAQVNSYTSTITSNSYASITGGTFFHTGTADDANSVQNIGFPFTYNGTSFTQINVNTNGNVRMGTAANTSYSPISAGTSNTIAAFGGDLQGNGGGCRVQTLGVAPNRICVIQWALFRRWNNASDNFNFQVRLYETDMAVELNYCLMISTGSHTKQIGLRGVLNSDFNNRTTTTSWTGATIGGTNAAAITLSATVFPGCGVVYRYAVPALPICSGTPAPGNTLSSAGAAACPSTNFTLSLQNQATLNLNSGFSYQWQSSPDNITYLPIAAQTGSSATLSLVASTWYRCVVTCSNGGATANSTAIQVTLNPFFNCYAPSVAGSAADSELLRVELGSLNNVTTCAQTGITPPSILNRYSQYTNLPAPTLTQGVNTAFTYQQGNCLAGDYGKTTKVWIDYDQNGVFDPITELAFVPAAGGALNGTYVSDGVGYPFINVPFTALPGITGMRVVMQETGSTGFGPTDTYTWGETEDYVVNIAVATACSGTPAASNSTASSPSACSGATVSLNTSVNYLLSGFTFQWEEGATAGGPWSAIVGQTNQNGSVVYNPATPFYRCRINCTGFGTERITTPVNVLESAFNQCYCSNPAIFAGDEDIFNVTIGTLNNTSSCLTTGGVGSILERYANYTGVPAPALLQATPYPMSVTVGTCGFEYAMSMRTWIDYNQDGVFAASELVYQGPTITGWTATHVYNFSITPPLSATPGVTGMRVICYETAGPAALDGCSTYNWGETEDYLVNITVPPPCSGTPAASSAVASLAGPVCPGDNLVLSLSPAYVIGGLTFQWQRSSDNITFVPISGANTQSAAISQTQASYYRCIVTCTGFGSPTTSSSTGLIGQNALLSCYCTSTATSPIDTEIFNVSFAGALNNTTSCVQTGTTGSVLGQYSNYTNLGPFAVDKGVLQSFSMNAGTCGGVYTAGVTVFIDFNANGIFEAGERLFTSGTISPSAGAGTLVSGTITIPGSAVNGNTVMRVILAETFAPLTIAACGTYGWGETEDYLINITTPPPCVGTPATPTMPGSPIEVLTATTATISPTGLTSGSGITYQWESAPAVGGPWNPVVAAVSASYTTGPVAGSTWYRIVTDCSFSTLTSTSGSVEVRAVGGASCAAPYIVSSIPFQGIYSTVASGNNIGNQACGIGFYGGGNDYIFQVNLIAGINYEVSVANTSGTGWIAAFLKDNCSSTTGASSLICAESGTSNSAVGIATVPTSGTYFIVVDYWPAPSTSEFFVRIRQTPAAPGAGTTQFNAIGTTQSATTICSGVAGSTANAGASGVPTVCGGSTADDDVWYSFVATSTAVVINVDPGNNGVANSGADIGVELYGGTAAVLGAGLCLNTSGLKGVPEIGTIVGLVIGNTYFVRIYDRNVLWGSNLGNFTLCLTTPPPPVNDDCAGAVVLPLNGSCVNTTGNTVSATQSQAAIACTGFTGNADDDIWYRVDLAVPSDLNIRVSATGTAMDPVVQLFSGSCAGLTAQFCEDRSITGGSELISRSLGVGAYFIRVFHYGLGTGAGGGHTICAFSTSPAPRPVNDDLTGALTVPFVVDCSPQGPYTSLNATRTHTNSLTPVVGNSNDDVWFKFVATSGFVNITVQGGSGYNPVLQMFEITGNKTVTGEFPAVNNTAGNGSEEVIYYGLTVGATYFIRVYDFTAGNPTGNFTICVFRTPPPSNDLCVGAINLFQQNSATCVTPTIGFTLSATNTLAATPCTGTSDDDVFYSFVATSPTPTIEVIGIQGFDPVVNLRSASGCGTSITCANSTGVDGTEIINASGLTVGATYRIRIYSAGNGSQFMGVFSVCVYGIAVPPANDNCVGAFNLPNTSPCTSVNGLVTGATQSQPGCGGNANDDVWFSFIAANTTSTVTVVGGIGFDAVVEVFSGGCAGLVSIGCQDNTFDGQAENLVLSGLIPGNTYYVRTYHWSAADASTPNFSVCLTGQPPINDDATGAINLVLRQDIVPSIANGTNLGATNNVNPNIPVGSFANFLNDVWYRATVGDNGVVAVNIESTTIGDTRLRLYSGDPLVALTQIAFDDDGGPAAGSFAYVSGRTPGEVIYVCVDGFTLTTFGNFRVFASDGWVWDGQGGFAFNGTGNWINQGLGEGFPAPNATSIVNIPIGGGVVNQPVVSTSATIGGIYFKSSFASPATITINAGQTLTIAADAASPGRTIRGTGSFARVQGPGIMAFTGAASTVNFGLGLGTVRFGGFNPIAVTLGAGLNVNSNGKMIFENNSSLYAGGTNGLVNGNITYRRVGNTNALAYNYWGSPIAAGTIASLTSLTNNANTYEYNTSSTTGVDYAGTQAGWNPLGPASLMTPGRGYIATAAGNASFVGVPNQTNTPVTTTVGAINFNLVSNPFPAPLAAASFLSQNANAGGFIYLWDDDASGGNDYAAGDYIQTNGVGVINGPNSGDPFNGNIASCQGFFVNVSSAGTVNFNLTQRAVAGTNNSQFFETNVEEMLKLRIENEFDQSSETIIAFKDGATESYDLGIDGNRLPGNTSIALYTMVGEAQIAFNYFSPLTAERIVPLKALNVLGGVSSITMNQFDNFDASTVVYLEDVVNGVFHNLTANPTYTFSNGVVVDSTDRFRIHFRAPISLQATSDCSGMGLGKMILDNPNNTSVVAEVFNSSDLSVSTTEAFGSSTGNGQVVIENLFADNYRVSLIYADGSTTSKQAVIADGGMPVAASFQSSANNVSIADAIVEFQAIAPGATSVSWNFGDGTELVGDMNPVHAYMAPGVYTVTFTALNGGCGSEATTTITVTANSTGIANLAGVNGFTIYPNPANEIASLLLNLDRNETQVTVSIHDASGRLMNSHNVNSVRAGSIVGLDIDGLANGVYQVTVEGNNFKNVGRLTISK